MDLKEIDRKVVRDMLDKWPHVQTTAAQLAAMGYEKEMVREEFRAAMKRFFDSRRAWNLPE
jgi:hypothetical protein